MFTQTQNMIINLMIEDSWFNKIFYAILRHDDGTS
jgi:hypothetical protein